MKHSEVKVGQVYQFRQDADVLIKIISLKNKKEAYIECISGTPKKGEHYWNAREDYSGGAFFTASLCKNFDLVSPVKPTRGASLLILDINKDILSYG